MLIIIDYQINKNATVFLNIPLKILNKGIQAIVLCKI